MRWIARRPRECDGTFRQAGIVQYAVQWKKRTTFFVRDLASIGGHHSTAEVNIIINEIDASINLYAQLSKLAERRPIQYSLRLSAGAVLLHDSLSFAYKKVVLFFNVCPDTPTESYLVQKSTEMY